MYSAPTRHCFAERICPTGPRGATLACTRHNLARVQSTTLSPSVDGSRLTLSQLSSPCKHGRRTYEQDGEWLVVVDVPLLLETNKNDADLRKQAGASLVPPLDVRFAARQ